MVERGGGRVNGLVEWREVERRGEERGERREGERAQGAGGWG